MGESFGRYRLLERIGIGGMAEVFRATQRGVAGFERTVAIKRLLPQAAADPQVVSMFVEEAKLAVQLGHPNIAQVYDLGELDGAFFIAMEHVDGRSVEELVRRYLERGARLPIEAVCHVLREVAEALHYAHFAEDDAGRPLGVIHRDVSPQNILLSFGGEVKVIDFGLAKADTRRPQTQDGIVKGKLAYLSPEQAHGKPIDRRSDVFALGICAWEMLTGRRAFRRDDDRETILAVRAGHLERAGHYAPVPPALDLVVMKALAKNRDKRWRTALEVAEHLDRFARTAGLRFDRRDLRALMREAFPERYEGAPVEDAIALVTRKKARRRRRRAEPTVAPPSERPIGLDTVVEPMAGVTSTLELAWNDGGTDPGRGHDEDTVPGIVLPDRRR